MQKELPTALSSGAPSQPAARMGADVPDSMRAISESNPFPSVALVPLGCSKAQVDAEEMIGALLVNGYRLVPDPEAADVVVVNTCGFIEPAKEESIETILDAAQLKESHGLRSLVVTGCLAERYPEQLRADLPEVDMVVPWSEERELVARLDGMFGIERSEPVEWGHRTLISPRHWAYVKISEGCDHTCSFCSIPGIRGRHVSVPPDDIVEQVTRLVDLGVKEFNLVAQDTTLYGADLYGKLSLPMLLGRLADIPGVRWLRLFYAHPAHVNDELMDVMASREQVLPYLDLPIQHINDHMLKSMRRIVGRTRIEELIASLRERVPGITLRTSLIVGMPSETEGRFQELVDFLPEAQFDRLGCFTYSKEEGTRAADMTGHVPEQVSEDRRAIVMEVQREISRERNEARIGSECDTLIDRVEDSAAVGRSAGEAPEVDGEIRVHAQTPLEPGDMVRVLVTGADDYDLTAETV